MYQGFTLQSFLRIARSTVATSRVIASKDCGKNPDAAMRAKLLLEKRLMQVCKRTTIIRIYGKLVAKFLTRHLLEVLDRFCELNRFHFS